MSNNTSKKTIGRSKPKKKKKVLTPEQKLAKKENLQKQREKRTHINAIRKIMANMGFYRLTDVSGHNFKFDDRPSELDDVFVNENIILLVEYTTE
jgi:hypothetical protein